SRGVDGVSENARPAGGPVIETVHPRCVEVAGGAREVIEAGGPGAGAVI
ncbi:MAG: hypothetical protein HY897_01190, partial [Deltaproteobacteria bacterium]|nr:hypothetical protein [Deltaproteobacteria bacterium]